MSLLGTVIPSFTSTNQRYIGTKLSSTLFMSGSNAAAGNFNLFANQYYDGSNVYYSRLNETGVNLFLTGATATSTNGYVLAMGDSISHAADVTATNVFMHTVNYLGSHGIGHPTTNNALVHNVYGSVNLGTLVPSFSSSAYRYVGSKIASVLMTNGSSSGATLIYGNGYFDGSNNKRSSGTQNNCRLTIAGNTSTNMLAFEFDAGGTVDTNVSYVNYFNIDQNANVTLGTSTLNPTHIINGALSATNNSTSNQTVFYANTSGTSGIPTVLSRSTTGANTTFLGFNTGGSGSMLHILGQ
jgi:hypothetical protein